ncbi:YfcC family protein [Mailhella sp.]|uniref:YfcC family protein n=1 Tax=Mailhella sp. TaxID=1981029 RepID=UPI003AB44B80
MTANAKKFSFPNSLVIVFVMMILAAVLTHIIPAGSYDYVPGTKLLDPATYHGIPQQGVSPWGLVDAVFAGMVKAGPIIVFTFLVGGYFQVLISSNAVDVFIHRLVERLGSHSFLILPSIIVIMSVLGASGVMANPVVATIPIGVILARRLGADKITGVAIMFLAAYGGYATSPVCAMTVQIAQQISGLPMLSGFGFRCGVWLFFLIPTALFIVRHARRVRLAAETKKNDDPSAAETVPFNARHALALLGLAAGLGVYVWGSLSLHWGMNYMAGIMMLVAMFGAMVTGMGMNGFVTAFLQGARQMTFSAMLIGLATGISVVLSEGHILHSIIYGMAVALNGLHHALVAPVMFIFNLLFNFFVPSGSGQAAVVMPIMAPLSDVVHVSRQTAVLAFQLGDGLSNVIFPTNGTMMASIAMAGLDYRTWARWVLPLFLLWTVMAVLVMAVAVASGL